MSLYLCSPRDHVVGAGFERCRVAYHFVQHADNIGELWPGVSVFLPAVQHQLVQHYWTVHGSWKSEVLLYGIYHLGHSRRVTQEKEKTQMTTKGYRRKLQHDVYLRLTGESLYNQYLYNKALARLNEKDVAY